jgi:predicted esterase
MLVLRSTPASNVSSTRARIASMIALACTMSGCGDEGGSATTDAGSSSEGGSGSDTTITTTQGDGSTSSPSGSSFDSGLDDSSSGSSDTGELPAAPSVALFNVVRGATETAFAPVPALLYRVEIPPRVTLEATVPAGTVSVSIVVDDGAAVVDDAAPFLLDEDETGAAIPWSLAFGSHSWSVTAYAAAGATGDVLGAGEGAFELSNLGMDPDYVPLTPEEHGAWVGGQLDAAMEVRSFVAADGHVLPYRLYTPEFYDATVRYPVLIYLHGRGQRGSDNPSALYSSQLFHGPQSIVAPDMQHELPSVVIVPQCGDVPSNEEWAHWIGNSEAEPFAGLGADGSYMQHADPWPSAQAVRELVDALQDELSVEPARVYLTGESMGGFGTWEFTTRWPEAFAVGVPMAGFSDPTKVDLIVDIPFWVFHGDADESNPVQGSRNMVEALQNAGGTVIYSEYAGLGHGETFNRAWTEETELPPWIFSQRKGR